MNKKNNFKKAAALLLGIALTAGSTGCNFIVTNNEKSYYKISLLKRTMQLVVEPLNKED